MRTDNLSGSAMLRAMAAAALVATSLIAQAPVELARKALVYRIWPESLRVDIAETERRAVTVARPVDGLGPVTELQAGEDSTSWVLGERGLRVVAKLDSRRLQISVRSDRVQTLSWPTLPLAGVRELSIPTFEGVLVPTGDEELMSWLRDRGELSATEGLSMPFIGLHFDQRSVACMLPEPHYDSLQLSGEDDPAAGFRHEWTSNRVGSAHTVVYAIGDGSPIGAALCYRSWLQDHDRLVTLEQKIEANPRVRLLLGAPHAYLWGSSYLSHLDIPHPKWSSFAAEFLEKAKDADSFAGRCAPRLSAPGRAALEEIRGLKYPYRYVKSVATDALCAVLKDASLAGLGDEAANLDVIEKNARMLAAEFPGTFGDVDTWGNGVSTTTLDAIHAAGIDRMLLCTGDLLDAAEKPHVVERAREIGFLIGPYDSYHSIHSPGTRPDDTWTTAQFGRQLYESGGIIGLDGKPSRGFKKRGFHLSPIAARPHVENRVSGLMEKAPYGAWFVDCDGYGQFFDDAHPDHPATRLDDASARRDRLTWLSNRHGLVVGSEGASAVMTSAFHFSHGVMTPVFGWGDPALTDKGSKYYFGQYWPPEEPKRFFAPVPVAAKYLRPYFTPADRAPLFQAVFGDCIVTTHQWGYASRKFEGQLETTRLLELLYAVPPLYHLNREQWQKQKADILRHYEFWSPLHRALATRPMIGFRHLTEDRQVQQTIFQGPTGPVRLTANFDDEARTTGDGIELPGRSLTVTGALRLESLRFTAEAKR